MATVLPVAVDGLSRVLDRQVTGHHAPMTYVIGDVPVMLPVRIADASQGWALYFVSAARAQTYLAEQGHPFTVLDVGGGRAPLAVLGIDYRGTDLGTYRELGIALFVRPRDDPSEMPGMLFLSLTVSDAFNVDRATVLWGYHKTLAQDFAAGYGARAALFAIDGSDPAALSVSFPRFGSGRSTGIPCYTYGVIKDAAGKGVPHKTLISRSATGEGMQIGGSVELRLGDGTQKQCVCRLGPGAGQACVCLMLRELGLPKEPAANGWSEHMSAQVWGSVPCKHSTSGVGGRVFAGVVTEQTIVAAAKAGRRLVLSKGAVLTPLARDKAKQLGLEIERKSR